MLAVSVTGFMGIVAGMVAHALGVPTRSVLRARRGFGSCHFQGPEHFMEATQPSPVPSGGPNEHGMMSALSNEMVRIYKGQFGRGPTKTRSQWAGPDVLVVTLEQTLTPAEHSLCRLGEHGRLRELRLLFQYAELELFCEPVERLTGRRVRAFLSSIDSVSDIATETFVLHPPGYDGPSRAEIDPADKRVTR